MIDGKLRCSACEAWKAPEGFYRRASKATGLRSYCRECDNACQSAYSAANPDKARASNLRRRGWTPEMYEAALTAQGGKCANPGCDVRHTDSKRLYADHDHATGLARVLLCRGCNCALGNLGEDQRRIDGLSALVSSFTN